jgi:hypothetical protein
VKYDRIYKSPSKRDRAVWEDLWPEEGENWKPNREDAVAICRFAVCGLYEQEQLAAKPRMQERDPVTGKAKSSAPSTPAYSISSVTGFTSSEITLITIDLARSVQVAREVMKHASEQNNEWTWARSREMLFQRLSRRGAA